VARFDSRVENSHVDARVVRFDGTDAFDAPGRSLIGMAETVGSPGGFRMSDRDGDQFDGIPVSSSFRRTPRGGRRAVRPAPSDGTSATTNSKLSYSRTGTPPIASMTPRELSEVVEQSCSGWTNNRSVSVSVSNSAADAGAPSVQPRRRPRYRRVNRRRLSFMRGSTYKGGISLLCPMIVGRSDQSRPRATVELTDE